MWSALAAAIALAAACAAPAGAGAGPVHRTAGAGAFSHAALDTVLARFLHQGRVDYRGLAADPGALARYLAACAAADPDSWTRAEQIAFWVNAYNARVLEGVIRRPGLKSVLDSASAGGTPAAPFFRERRPIAGTPRSLDDIEHRILRAHFHEPRVHFVLNCGAAACPALPERALRGDRLDQELEQATARFLADTTRNRIDPRRGLELSAIFDWYGGDFRAAAGSLQGFIERHWPRRGERWAPDLPVRFRPYDWSLDGAW